jgi:hypothetical protein
MDEVQENNFTDYNADSLYKHARTEARAHTHTERIRKILSSSLESFKTCKQDTSIKSVAQLVLRGTNCTDHDAEQWHTGSHVSRQ